MKLRDISKYQGEINFDKLSEDHKLEALIIRAGYRGYSNGVITVDKQLDKNTAEAERKGIPYGLYFYSQAITEAERVEEAEFLIEEAQKNDEILFLALDMEMTGSGIGRADKLDKRTRQNIANTFRDKVNDRGYTAVIYSNEYYFKTNLDYESDKYLNWVRNWTAEPKIPHEIWQYTNNGTLPGINTAVDLNKSEWSIEDFTGKDMTYKLFKKINDDLVELGDLITRLKAKMML